MFPAVDVAAAGRQDEFQIEMITDGDVVGGVIIFVAVTAISVFVVDLSAAQCDRLE